MSRVALYITCLVDLFRPSVGFASVRLLEAAGYEVDVPLPQSCCGQPAYNSGDQNTAATLARQVIAQSAPYDYVVLPSGSCAGMLKCHYPMLLANDPDWNDKAVALADKTFELTKFLTDVAGGVRIEAAYPHAVTYHDACAGLRELGVRAQPRALLAQVSGLELREMAETEVCCGFGGTFCVKYPEISERMVSDKTRDAAATGAETLLAGDLGCLLNIAGRMTRLGVDLRCYHVAEVLAGMAEAPAIAEGE